MALLKTIATDFGIEVKNAYVRVESLNLIGKDKIQFQVKSYAHVTAIPFGNTNVICSYDLNGENPIKQAYEHLKSLPEFAGSIDC